MKPKTTHTWHLATIAIPAWEKEGADLTSVSFVADGTVAELEFDGIIYSVVIKEKKVNESI